MLATPGAPAPLSRPVALNRSVSSCHHSQMPNCSRGVRGPHEEVGDPLTACLDAEGTYICTAYSSRCYIIQKVRVRLEVSEW